MGNIRLQGGRDHSVPSKLGSKKMLGALDTVLLKPVWANCEKAHKRKIEIPNPTHTCPASPSKLDQSLHSHISRC